MRGWLVAGVLMLVAVPSARAIPENIGLSGFLTEAGDGPAIDGTVALTVRFYLGETDAVEAALYSETFPTVAIDNGAFYLRLGATAGVDTMLFAQRDEMWLGVRVNEDRELRFPMASVATALTSAVAEDALLLDGRARTDLFTSDDPLAFSGLEPCVNDGEILKTVEGTWACVTGEEGATYSAGVGLALSAGNQFSLTIPGCADGEVVQYQAGAYVCAALGPTVSAGNGLTLNAGVLALRADCEEGQVLKAGAGGVLDCEADAEAVTTAGGGLEKDGSTLSLRADCGTNQVLKFGPLGTWVCEDDVDTNTTYSAGNGLELSGTALGIRDDCDPNQVLKWSGTAWACGADTNTDTNTTYSAGSGLELSGTALAIRTDCDADQVVKWSGTEWVCDDDADIDTNTTYTVTDNLSLATTTIGLRQDCAEDEILKADAEGVFGCAADQSAAANDLELGTASSVVSGSLEIYGGDDGEANPTVKIIGDTGSQSASIDLGVSGTWDGLMNFYSTAGAGARLQLGALQPQVQAGIAGSASGSVTVHSSGGAADTYTIDGDDTAQFLSIGANACSTEDELGQSQAGYYVGSTKKIFCPLDLAHGARVHDIVCHFRDSDGQDDAFMGVYRHTWGNWNTSGTLLADAGLGISSGTVNVDASIDNENYQYVIQIEAGPTTGGDFYGCRVEATPTRPRP